MIRLLLLPFRLLLAALAVLACALLLLLVWSMLPASTVATVQAQVFRPAAGALRYVADRLDGEPRDGEGHAR